MAFQWSLFLLVILSAPLANAAPPISQLDLELAHTSAIGDLQRVKQAVKSGANLEARFQHYELTPFLLAIYHQHNEVVHFLVEQGADLNAVSQRGKGALMYAIANKDLSMAQWLLQQGANPKYQYDLYSTLFLAAHYGSEPFIRLLLPYGFELNRLYNYRKRESKGFWVESSALIQVIEAECLVCAKLLVEAGADVNLSNSRGESPLLVALKNKQSAIVGWLLGQGAKLDAVDDMGNSVLSYAIRNGDEPLALRAVESGLDLHKWLDWEVGEDKYQRDSWIKRHSADRDQINYLHLAAKYGRVTVIKALLEHGLSRDMLQKSDIAFPALGVALFHGQIEAARYLLQQGADPFAIYKGRGAGSGPLFYFSGHAEQYTPLALALVSKNEGLARLMMEQSHFNRYVDLVSPDFHLYLYLFTAEKLVEKPAFAEMLERLERAGYRPDERVEKLIERHVAENREKMRVAAPTPPETLSDYLNGDDLSGVLRLIKEEKDQGRKYGAEALWSALLRDKPHWVQPMVDAGVNLKKVEDSERYPLIYLVKYGSLKKREGRELFQWLVQQGGDINFSNGEVLFRLTVDYVEQASRENFPVEDRAGFEEAIRWVLEHGATLGEQSTKRLIAIYSSGVSYQRLNEVGMLRPEMDRLKREADLQKVFSSVIESNDVGYPRFEEAQRGLVELVRDSYRLQISPGLDSLLHLAVKHYYFDLAETLLIYGADPESEDESGNRIAHHLVKIMLSKRAKSEDLKGLLWYGLDSNAENHDGITPDQMIEQALTYSK